jgi:hypothetical protein
LLGNEDVGIRFGRRNRKIVEERNDYHKEMAKIETIYVRSMSNTAIPCFVRIAL